MLDGLEVGDVEVMIVHKPSAYLLEYLWADSRSPGKNPAVGFGGTSPDRVIVLVAPCILEKFDDDVRNLDWPHWHNVPLSVIILGMCNKT